MTIKIPYDKIPTIGIISVCIFFLTCAGILGGLITIRLMNGFRPSIVGHLNMEPKWKAHFKYPIVGNIIADDNQVYVLTLDKVYGIEQSYGKINWEFSLPASLAGGNYIAIKGGKVIVTTGDGTLTAINSSSGKLIWQNKSKGGVNSSNYSAHSLLLINNIAIVTYISINITAYDIQTGAILWQIPLPDRTNIFIATDNNSLFVSEEYSLFAFDLRSGGVLWKLDFDSIIGPIIVEENRIYLLQRSGTMRIISIDSHNKNIIWDNSVFAVYINKFPEIYMDKDNVYIVGEKIYMISKTTGSLVWSSEKISSYKQLAYYNSVVMSTNDNGTVDFFDKLNGALLGHIKYPLSINTNGVTPIISGDKIFVTWINQIYTYELSN
jgi:outer membrane protein assembly factor BamB